MGLASAELAHLRCFEAERVGGSATKGASNRLIDVESLSEEELDVLKGYFRQLVELAKRDRSLTESHSVEEAERRHGDKSAG